MCVAYGKWLYTMLCAHTVIRKTASHHQRTASEVANLLHFHGEADSEKSFCDAKPAGCHRCKCRPISGATALKATRTQPFSMHCHDATIMVPLQYLGVLEATFRTASNTERSKSFDSISRARLEGCFVLRGCRLATLSHGCTQINNQSGTFNKSI